MSVGLEDEPEIAKFGLHFMEMHGNYDLCLAALTCTQCWHEIRHGNKVYEVELQGLSCGPLSI